MSKIMQDVIDMANTQYTSWGDYSVTDLITPPRVVRLKKRYGHLAKPTIKGSIASLMGSGIHEYIEKMLKLANVIDPLYTLERSVYDFFVHPDFEEYGRRLITGRFDILYDNKDIFDIKTANVWKTIFDPDLKDWHEQQNIYAYLLGLRGINVETINIICIYKDWKQGDALRDSSYPQSQVVEYPLALWPAKKTKEFILERLAMHMKEEQAEDTDLPICSREERWERHPKGVPIIYAWMPNVKSKRASKTEGSMEDLLKWARDKNKVKGDAVIEVRYAKPKRCVDYCNVNDHCNWYKSYQVRAASNNMTDILPAGEVL
jgi:hypothetical protein